MRKCNKCLIPESVTGVAIGNDGICNLCRAPIESTVTATETQRLHFEADLDETLKRVAAEKKHYHCVVPFSGGKDSTYLLHRLKYDYGLNVLAYTVNIDLPGIAWKNIHRTLRKLDIDHVTFSPSASFLKKLFSYLLKNQEARGAVYTVSYVYAPLFEGAAIRLAMEKRIPLVLAGYSPGQPDPARMLYEFSTKLIQQADWTPPHLKECGLFNETELQNFYNAAEQRQDSQFPRYLAPFHAWPYDQNDIMKKVVELGLVASTVHASPILSNYPINWLMMYSDLIHFGFNPYAPEFSDLIRSGKANLTYWKMMGPLVDWMIRHQVLLGRNVSKSLQWLELSKDDLKITLPSGAYDPDLSTIP